MGHIGRAGDRAQDRGGEASDLSGSVFLESRQRVKTTPNAAGGGDGRGDGSVASDPAGVG